MDGSKAAAHASFPLQNLGGIRRHHQRNTSMYSLELWTRRSGRRRLTSSHTLSGACSMRYAVRNED